MPFIDTKTNVHITKEQSSEIKTAFGKAISCLKGKSETWLMISLDTVDAMYFQGSDAPCAICTVSVYGKADEADANRLTKAITEVLHDILNISGDRVYVSYRQTDLWGWNGENF